MFHSHCKRIYPTTFPFENYCNERFKSVLEDIKDFPCRNEEEKKFTNDEYEQYFEREAYYTSENEEDIALQIQMKRYHWRVITQNL
jgi:hypothetical protein